MTPKINVRWFTSKKLCYFNFQYKTGNLKYFKHFGGGGFSFDEIQLGKSQAKTQPFFPIVHELCTTINTFFKATYSFNNPKEEITKFGTNSITSYINLKVKPQKKTIVSFSEYSIHHPGRFFLRKGSMGYP